MKKRPSKKLSLHRETLAQLENVDLHKVAGGYTEACQYSNGRRTCTTCDMWTCTTNYC